MDTSTVIGIIATAVPVLGTAIWKLVSVSLKLGVATNKQEELEKDLDDVRKENREREREWREQMEGDRQETKQLYQQLVDELKNLSRKLEEAMNRIEDKYVTKEHMAQAMVHYDGEVTGSKADRRCLWEAVDDIRSKMLTKQEHKDICGRTK